MKQYAKNAYCALWKYSGAMVAQETVRRWTGQAFIPILLFHRVTDEIPLDGLTVSTAWFRGLCRMLQDRFHVISLAEFHRILRSGETPSPRTVAITFDDCYRDNLFAARVLAEHNLPACFFVPTQYVGTDHVFDWDRELKRMPNLSWNDVREMTQLGHEIGSHSVSHPNLGQLDADQTRQELIVSKQTIEDQLALPVRWFAYPYGGKENFRLEHLPLVHEAGYDTCFSGFGGFVYPHRPTPIVPRAAMPDFRSLLNLELFLTGCMNWIHSLKRRAGMIA